MPAARDVVANSRLREARGRPLLLGRVPIAGVSNPSEEQEDMTRLGDWVWSFVFALVIIGLHRILSSEEHQ